MDCLNIHNIKSQTHVCISWDILIFTVKTKIKITEHEETNGKHTQSISFADLEMVPILVLVFHTRGYLGLGPFAAHT